MPATSTGSSPGGPHVEGKGTILSLMIAACGFLQHVSFVCKPWRTSLESYLKVFNGYCQMLTISNFLSTIPLSINQSNVLLRMLHFHVLQAEVAISDNGPSILSPA